MTSVFTELQAPNPAFGGLLRAEIGHAIEALIDSLPNPESLAPERQRGIITRYTAVLEGNFIYWMTGAYLAAKSEEAREIILENLHEEVRDCHPGMLRRFALAAHAIPTDADFMVVHPQLRNVRLFIGRLSPVRIIVTMAFFEGFIQRFMPYLADLAGRQGSSEREYTDVHGICDITHTEELFRALGAEMALNHEQCDNLFEGVDLLRALIQTVVHGNDSSSLQLLPSNGTSLSV